MLIAILGVLKAGAAYVPLDASYPDDRLAYVLEDTQAYIVITQEYYQGRLKALVELSCSQLTVLAIESLEVQSQLYLQPSSNPEAITTSSHLAYVIYTSGTTGQPKGVMIQHGGYLATIDCIKNLYFTQKQKIKTYSMTDYVFDIFGLEYGLSLLSGGIVTIGSKNFSNLDCSTYDFIQMTPSLCNLKIDNLTNIHCVKLFIGGESLDYILLRKLLNQSVDVINVYGPTETTIWSVSKLYPHTSDEEFFHLGFGKPCNNEKVYVLDNNLNPLPVGAIGELYIGGAGLARGYLNKADLTAEKFIANPFQNVSNQYDAKNSRLYKTGDLVRWLSDGNLEYIGRNDFQVKIRGYRIELGEIEAALSSYEGIEQCVVLAKEHAGDVEHKYLVGYYVSKIALDARIILEYLKTRLPEYMIPSSLVHMGSLPLTINGKLDRKALPEPVLTSTLDYRRPRNELESQTVLSGAKF